MRDRQSAILGCFCVVISLSNVSAQGGDWPFHRRATPDAPNSMTQVARSIDCMEDKIRDDGTIVIKRPDIWGQARMSKYRLDFEKAITPKMEYGNDGFHETLQAVLARSDLRASNFTRVKFVRTDLRDADLRRSSFNNCTFEGAVLDRAILTHNQGTQLRLTETQRQVIAFTNDDGAEPNGG